MSSWLGRTILIALLTWQARQAELLQPNYLENYSAPGALTGVSGWAETARKPSLLIPLSARCSEISSMKPETNLRSIVFLEPGCRSN